ncbi:MAG: hypothetical protein AAFP90_14450 [Planctomycetota bacterium]
MNETEAKEFIRTEVKTAFNNQLWKVGTVLGVTNLLAIAGLYWAVLQTSRSIAKSTASTTATQTAELEVTKHDSAIEQIEGRISMQSSDLDVELKKLGGLQSRMETSVTSQQRLSERLQDTDERIGKLSKLAKSVEDTDETKMSRIITSIKASPDVEKIFTRLDSLGENLDTLSARVEADSAIPDWTKAELLNGWKHYNNPGHQESVYSRSTDGVVRIEGMISSGGMDTVAFKLPDDFAPNKRLVFNVLTHSDVTGRVDVLADGSVLIVDGNSTWFSLNGISFASKPPTKDRK